MDVGQAGAGARPVDPYWDGVWTRANQIGWASRSAARRIEDAGLGHLHVRWAVDPDVALQRLLQPHNFTPMVEALGAVNQWRTMTLQQLARLTGMARLGALGKEGESLVSALFAAGLIDYGVPMVPMAKRAVFHPGQLLIRPAQSTAFHRHIAPHLTHPEMIRVTAGDDFRQARQADRHNVLATEFGLRAAAQCDVSAVLGELSSTIDLLAYSGLGRDKPDALQSSADLTLVRSDGMRIAVEITATVGNRFKQKVDSWAKTFREVPFTESGLVVLFVEAAVPERVDAPGRSVMYDVRQAVRSAAQRFPGTPLDRVASRMAVATWRDFFPAAGAVSDAFVPLRAERPTGVGDDVWEPVDLLDVFEFTLTPRDPVALLQVVSNSRALAGTPVQCEARFPAAAPDLAAARLRSTGFDPLPVPPPGRGTRRRPVGTAWGPVPAPLWPPRLRVGR